MSRLNPTLWPIRLQIAALLIVTQFLAQLVTVGMINLSTEYTGGGPTNLAISASEPMLTALRMNGPEDARGMEERLSALPAIDDRFTIDADPAFPRSVQDQGPRSVFETVLHDQMPAYWRDRVRIFSVENGSILPMFPLTGFAIAAEMPGGSWLIYQPRSNSFVQNVPRAVAFMGLLILALPLMFLSIWAGSALVAPIADLARGVERFAGNADVAELPERGPVEVRRATNAVNRMRQRILKLIGDRSQTLASIGHDMRTPLTRLRLRVELLDEGPAKAAIEQDVVVLERMIDDALTFLRSESRPLNLDLLDMAVLTRTVVDEHADLGHKIVYHGPTRLTLRCDHDLIRRVLENLIGNAAKFATEATVTLSEPVPDRVRVEVRDNGPGIPLDHRDKVLEPFARIEAVRSGTAQKSEGFGLGLAIARDLVERHGGTLALTDNQPTGLVVTVTLPRPHGSSDAGAVA